MKGFSAAQPSRYPDFAILRVRRCSPHEIFEAVTRLFEIQARFQKHYGYGCPISGRDQKECNCSKIIDQRPNRSPAIAAAIRGPALEVPVTNLNVGPKALSPTTPAI